MKKNKKKVIFLLFIFYQRNEFIASFKEEDEMRKVEMNFKISKKEDISILYT